MQHLEQEKQEKAAEAQRKLALLIKLATVPTKQQPHNIMRAPTKALTNGGTKSTSTPRRSTPPRSTPRRSTGFLSVGAGIAGQSMLIAPLSVDAMQAVVLLATATSCSSSSSTATHGGRKLRHPTPSARRAAAAALEAAGRSNGRNSNNTNASRRRFVCPPNTNP